MPTGKAATGYGAEGSMRLRCLGFLVQNLQRWDVPKAVPQARYSPGTQIQSQIAHFLPVRQRVKLRPTVLVADLQIKGRPEGGLWAPGCTWGE